MIKKIGLSGFILVLFISACAPATSNLTVTADIQSPTGNGQQGVDMTREYSAMQTIIAGEQLTETPTPTGLTNLPNPWTEINATTPTSVPHSAVATIIKT